MASSAEGCLVTCRALTYHRRMALLALTATVLAGIYPEGHFDHVTKCTKDTFEDFVKEKVDSGKTLFVRWIASEG